MATSRHSDFVLYRRLPGQVRPYLSHRTGVLPLSLLTAPLAVLNPLPLKMAVDSVIGTHPLPPCVGAGSVAEKALAVLDATTYGRTTCAQDSTQ
jgi:ATP-binding cassette, subfamily B, bacterial